MTEVCVERYAYTGNWILSYVLLCAILIFRTSSLDSLLPSCSATAWIISGQCKSAADSVKNHVGMPKECNIANT